MDRQPLRSLRSLPIWLIVLAAVVLLPPRHAGAQTGPAGPQPYQPAYGAYGVQNPVTLAWYASYGAVAYDVAWMDAANGYWNWSGYLYGQTYLTLSLNAGDTYYWLVYACDYYACNPGPEWYFTVASAAPAPPQLYSPAYGANGVTSPVTLAWYPGAGDSNYLVDYEDATANSGWQSSPWLGTQTSYTLYGLNAGDTYYWLVYGCSSYCAASATWYFTMAAPPPAAPQLYSPAYGASGLTNPVTVTWYQAGNDSNYLVYYEDATTNTGWQSSPWLGAQTSYTLPSLNPGDVYDWMVYGCTNTCVASSTWYFVMAAPPPTAPQLDLPANGATGVSDPATVAWYAATNDTSYYAYYDDVSNQSGWVGSPNLGTATSYGLPQLPAGDTVYWYAYGCTYTCAGSVSWDFVLQQPMLQTPPNCTATGPSGQWKYGCGSTVYQEFGSPPSDTYTVWQERYMGSLGNDPNNDHWYLAGADVWAMNPNPYIAYRIGAEQNQNHTNQTFPGYTYAFDYTSSGGLTNVQDAATVYYCFDVHNAQYQDPSNPNIIHPAADNFYEVITWLQTDSAAGDDTGPYAACPH